MMTHTDALWIINLLGAILLQQLIFGIAILRVIDKLITKWTNNA